MPGVRGAAALLLLTLATLPVAAAAEDQRDYPTGAASIQEPVGDDGVATLHVTPKLSIDFLASAAADVNVTVTVAWRSANLPTPLPEAERVLSYIQVAGDEAGAQVRFRCLVDEVYAHDLLYWDGAGWVALSANEGGRIAARGGEDLPVVDVHEEGGLFTATVGHASSFALTSTTRAETSRAVDDAGAPAPPVPGLVLALCALALMLRRT